jgi:drug/metabolite transporter (DMT)-like permease
VTADRRAIEARAGGRRDVVGGLLVALGAVLFGSVVVIGRTETVQDLPVPSLLAVRFGVAALLLAGILGASGRSLRPGSGEWLPLLALGALGYGVESGLFFLALGRGTAATVTLLFYTYPVWVAVMSAALGMGVPGLLVGGSLVAAVAGSGLVVGATGGLDITAAGIAFALASSVAISLFLVGLERWVRRTPPLVSSVWVAMSASAALAVAAVATGARFPTGGEAWLAVVAMGVLTSGAFGLLFLGVRRLGAVRSSIVASLEPVMAAVLALAFLGEALRLGVIGGGALILGGAVAASMARGRPEPEAGP